MTHRIVSYTYGEQNEGNSTSEDEQERQRENMSNMDESNEKNQKEMQSKNDVSLWLDGDADEDGSDDDDEAPENHESNAPDTTKSKEEVETEKDPLDLELGYLAPLAKILHMTYLSVVLIAGNIAASFRKLEALCVWDTMAYLAAFQGLCVP